MNGGILEFLALAFAPLLQKLSLPFDSLAALKTQTAIAVYSLCIRSTAFSWVAHSSSGADSAARRRRWNSSVMASFCWIVKSSQTCHYVSLVSYCLQAWRNSKKAHSHHWKTAGTVRRGEPPFIFSLRSLPGLPVPPPTFPGLRDP